MKKMLIVWVMLMSTVAFAQIKTDEERMQRDIEVAENILSTLIKQQLSERRTFFPIEVQGTYLPGYGVTFRLPSGYFENMIFMKGEGDSWNIDVQEPPVPAINGEPAQRVKSYGSYSYSSGSSEDRARTEARASVRTPKKSVRKGIKYSNSDSTRNSYNEKLLEAAKSFIADYGDLLTQLQPNERITITNKREGREFPMVWAGSGFEKQRQSIITVEGAKSDVNQFRQGKISRDQLMSKLRVINSEISDELQPDLELLTSIFNRVYSRDLSKTFFCDDNIYYERLKDFGAVYHMEVYASSQINGYDEPVYEMPTVHLTEIDQATRDKKVKELYPEFEKSIKEDLLEYGRTLKSLKDEETLMFEIQMTRCKGCNIPSTLELSVKNSILKDYSSGKITKDAALAKITVKKGPDQ